MKITERVVYTVQRTELPFNKNVKGFYRFSEALAKARRLKGSIRIIEEVYQTFNRRTTRQSVKEVWVRG